MSRLLHPFCAPTKTDFITIVRGEGARVFDDRGRSYVDGLASLWYVAAGHGRREIIDAVTAQMSTLEAFHTFDPFTNEPAERVAERIAGLAPMADSRIFLVQSGSEAVDSAIKLARIAQVQAGHPERTLVVSREHGYHGVTYGGLSAQGLPVNQKGFGPLVGDFVNLPSNDLEAMSRLFAEKGDRIAAVLTEPLQGAGGVYPPLPGYLSGLRRLCDDHGAFLIFDEVICGFGRLGTWFGATHFGVQPDLITFAKAVTSGYVPLGGVIVGPAVRRPLEADAAFILRHGHTYSGHPTACAAALANLDVLERDGLVERAKHIGRRLSDGLLSLERDGVIAGVRGDGAVWAATMHEGIDNGAVRDGMLTHGVIARPLPGNALAFCPPLVITDADIDQCVDALAASLA